MSTDQPSGDLPTEVQRYLREQQILTLATATPTGVPHAATFLYVNDGAIFYCWTQPESTTARQLDQNPQVAFTIDEYAPDWRKTKGIQGQGDAQVLLNPAEIRHAVELFQEKFAALGNASSANLSFFRITPAELQFIDNEAQAGQAGAPVESTAPGGQALGQAYHRTLVHNVFLNLPRQEVATVAAQLDTVQVDADHIIVRQGAPADKFFIIVDGEVAVIHEDGGQQREVARLRQGQFFGEMAILRDMPRTATVRAIAPTTLLTMERDAFRTLVAQSLGTTSTFDDVIQQRMQELSAGPESAR